MDEDSDWERPKVTGNSALLLGYVMGLLATRDEYRAKDADAEAGTATVERTATGNRYRITVEQISGTE